MNNAVYKSWLFWIVLVIIIALLGGAAAMLLAPQETPVDPPSSAPVDKAPDGFAATVLSFSYDDGKHIVTVEPDKNAAIAADAPTLIVETASDYAETATYCRPQAAIGDRIWIETGKATLNTDGISPCLSPIAEYACLPDNYTTSLNEAIAIVKFLTAQENIGFVGSLHEYATPQDIDLHWALYDGMGIGRLYDDLTAEEIAAGVLIEYVAVTAFHRRDVERVFKAKTGIAVADLKSGTKNITYFETLDLYAIYHSDTNMFPVAIDSITVTQDGRYAVRYHDANGENSADGIDYYTVTLNKTADGYQFVSNRRS